MGTSGKGEPLAPAYVIWGEDRATVQRALERLIARVTAEGGLPPERFRGGETPAEDVVSACEALSFSGVRLVVVEDADLWRAADATPLAEYLATPNPATCLALIAGAAVTPALSRAVEAAGRVLHYGPDPKARPSDRTKWLVEHFRKEVTRAGGSVTAQVARRVIERVTVDRSDARRAGVIALDLSQEAGKLAAYAGGEPITAEMVEALVPPHPDARTYELADALVAADGRRAYALLQDLATGDSPVAPIVVQVQLTNHFRRVAEAQALGPEASADAIAAATGVSGYPARKLVEQSRALPRGAGAEAVVRLAALELDLRVSALKDLGRSADDGAGLVLESAMRDLLAIARGEAAAARVAVA
jgi:DNA polymerase III delta subunit